jgi:arylsulfatase A-like enzyme
MSRNVHQHPDILLMSCHDIGRYLGAYGVETVHTPSLDRLAATGVLMERAFTVSPGCSPSRAALATGRYPHSNGVMGLAHPPFGWSLRPDQRHMASLLAEAGYETHLFGHQHVSPDVRRLGFQHLHGFDGLTGCHEPALGKNVVRRFDAFMSEALPSAPLYMEINLEEPHRPYDQGGAVPDAGKGVTIPPYLPQTEAAHEEMADFQGAVRQADAAVGHILETVERAGRDTLVIFSADHGVAMPRAKCTLYDPGLEIALLLRWAGGGLSGGGRIGQMVSIIDVLPTVLALIGARVPEDIQGVSFLPLLRGEPATPRAAIFAEKTYHTYYDPMRAVRTERFKYIRNFEVAPRVEVPGDIQGGAIFRANPQVYTDVQHLPIELYDLTADPAELDNVAGKPEYADVQRWLDSKLWTWMAETGDPLLRGAIESPEAVAMRERWAMMASERTDTRPTER